MRISTTVRVSRTTHENLRLLAVHDGLTLDEEIKQLVRAERQRRIGQALSAVILDEADQRWLEIGVKAASDDARR
jgi:hypothetical protein